MKRGGGISRKPRWWWSAARKRDNWIWDPTLDITFRPRALMAFDHSGWHPSVYQADPGNVFQLWKGDEVYPTERMAVMAAYDQITFAVQRLRTSTQNDAATALLVESGWSPGDAARTVAEMNRRTRA